MWWPEPLTKHTYRDDFGRYSSTSGNVLAAYYRPANECTDDVTGTGRRWPMFWRCLHCRLSPSGTGSFVRTIARIFLDVFVSPYNLTHRNHKAKPELSNCLLRTPDWLSWLVVVQNWFAYNISIRPQTPGYRFKVDLKFTFEDYRFWMYNFHSLLFRWKLFCITFLTWCRSFLLWRHVLYSPATRTVVPLVNKC